MTLKVDGTNGVLQAYDYQVLTTGFSYTFAAGVQLLLAVPAGTLATGTVTMPANPVDGMNITITSTQQITALTVNANTGQSIVGGGAISMRAGGSQTFVYRLANTTWYSQNNNVAVSFGVSSQVFTSNGTFTIPANVTAVKVTVVGGGGGGGGAADAGSSYRVGAGGGAGGAAVSYLTGLTSGGTLAVTVGAAGAAGAAAGGTGGTGGTSSVASGTQTITTISATGGVGGVSGSASFRLGGAGGEGTNGTLNFTGNVGGMVMSDAVNFVVSGMGASGFFGGNAPSAMSAGTVGTAGKVYGGGGSGAVALGSARAGGAGAAGVVIFEW